MISKRPYVSSGENAGPDFAFSRRSLLASGVISAAALVSLAACSWNGTQQNENAEQGPPQRGGTLNVGIVTSGASEVVIPSFDTGPDVVRSMQLFDRLFDMSSDLKLKPALALSAESNADARLWTFRLRDGVVFHDGKPFGADDVVWTIRSWEAPDSRTYGAFNDIVDYPRVRAIDNLTVEVALKSPVAQFPSLVAAVPYVGITPDGVSLEELGKRPIGTGPFKYESFEPGVRSTFSANRDYWEKDKPYVDTLVINSSFADSTAIYNALLSGQVDVYTKLPGLQAKEQEASQQIKVLRSSTPNAMFFYMNINKAPFDDARVRKAIRLVADRQAIINNALSGYGTVRHDLPGDGLEYYAADLTISQNIEQAKALLAEAGQQNLTVVLNTSSGVPGGVEAATLLAQQAKAAGITIKINNIPATSYYSSANGYPYDFGIDIQSVPSPSLTAWWRSLLAAYPATGWDYANDKSLQAAIGEVDTARASPLWHDAQNEQFESGGFLLFGSFDLVDGVAKRVSGLTASPVGYLNGYRLLDAWLVKGAS
jgi:peptide/nickel transport system substrate-binding protein